MIIVIFLLSIVAVLAAEAQVPDKLRLFDEWTPVWSSPQMIEYVSGSDSAKVFYDDSGLIYRATVGGVCYIQAPEIGTRALTPAELTGYEVWRSEPALFPALDSLRVREERARAGSPVNPKPPQEDDEPDPPAGPVVSGYDALRTTACTPGDAVEITAARIGGTFVCRDASPVGADGGIAFAAPGGRYWVRQFAHTEAEPVEMDWYQLTEKADVTTLVTGLMRAYSPRLHIRVPSAGVDTLLLGQIYTSDYGITDLSILESTRPVVIHYPRQDSRWLTIAHEQPVRVVIGRKDPAPDGVYRLTMDGSHPHVGHHYGLQMLGSVMIGSRSPGGTIHFGANLSDTWGPGLQLGNAVDYRTSPQTGYYNKFTSAWVAGRFVNASVSETNTGQVHFEQVTISDSYGVGYGWNGEEDQDNAYYSELGVKGRGLTIGQNTDKVTGSVTLQYGWAHVFFGPLNYLGNGPDDRFELTFKDFGYTESGVALYQKSGIIQQHMKIDPGGDMGPGRKWLALNFGENRYGDRMGYGLMIEASNDDTQGQFRTGYYDIAWNVAESAPTSRLNWGRDYAENNWSRGHTLRGSGPGVTHLVQMQDSHTIEGGRWREILLEYTYPASQCTNRQAPVAGYTCDSRDEEWIPVDNTIRDATVTSRIVVQQKAVGTLLDNVAFTGTGDVMAIGQGAVVTIGPGGLSAPNGARIVGDASGAGSLRCAGQSVALPYVFGQGGVCESIAMAEAGYAGTGRSHTASHE